MSEGRRKPIPRKVKLAVLARQDGFCICGCGQYADGTFIYDHNPALELRLMNDDGTDTIPPANDPNYIDAVCPDYNKRKTYGTKSTTAGSDANRIAKVKRILKGGKKRRGPPMRSQGFRKDVRRKMDGTVEKVK